MSHNKKPTSNSMAAVALATSLALLPLGLPTAAFASSDNEEQVRGTVEADPSQEDPSTSDSPADLSSLETVKISAKKHTISIGTKSARFVSVKNDSIMNGAGTYLLRNKKLGGQSWTFKRAGSGKYYIVNSKSGRALTAAKNSSGKWSKLIIKSLKKSSSQKWCVKKDGDACYVTASVGNDLCLTAGSKRSSGRTLELAKWEGSTSQAAEFGNSKYKITRKRVLYSLKKAKKSSAITGFGGVSFKSNSAAGKKVRNILKALRKSSKTCAFVMVDLNTGAGISSSASKRIYGASTIKAPYMTSLCKYRPSSMTGSARGHMYQVMSWSSNTDYTALRYRFGSSPMRKFLNYTNVKEITPGRTWVTYSPRTLAQLWTGTYYYLFKDTNKRSSLLQRYAKYGARSFIKGALNSKKGYTTYTKAGWGPFSRRGNIYNDAGIVKVKGHPYLLVVMSTALNHSSQLRSLVRALDAYHSYMLK